MKNLIISFALLVCFYPISYAQQWVDQVYEYDSITDVMYGSAINFNNNSVDLYMDIYLPKCQDTTTKRPLLMVVHGGGFIGGSPAEVKDICTQFARRGYVTVNVEYRLGYVNLSNLNVCNFVDDFECTFAADTMEWARASYRGIQDVKGAMRYMINRKDTYHIDENNVFVVGESAGAFIAMGVAYLDDPSERPAATFAIADAPAPNSNTWSCQHNVGEVFSGPIPRPDLGGIDGSIEPALYPFTIRGVGNIYGAMATNLLTVHNSAVKPALYSFHRDCDIVVPMGTDRVYYGASWCLSNCWGCSNIYNTPFVNGSQTIDDWNTNQSLGYDIQAELVLPPFPYDCIILPYSCTDQVFNGNGCHAYINKTATMINMATFFATKIVNPETCVPFNSIISLENDGLLVYPNPVEDILHIKSDQPIQTLRILDVAGNVVNEYVVNDISFQSNLKGLSAGIYVVECTFENGQKREAIIRK